MADDRDILTIGVDLDSRAATQGMAALQRQMLDQFKKVTKTVDRVGKANSKVAKQAAKDAKDWSSSLGDLTKYYQEEIDKIKALETALGRAEKAREDGDEAAQKAAEKRIGTIKKELQEQKKALKDKSSVGFDVDKMSAEAGKALGKAGDEFTGSLSSFFQKDLKGIIKGGGGIAAALTKSIGKGLAAGGGAVGGKLMGVGHAMGKKGAAKGGGAGVAMQGAGGAMKAIGGLSKSIGPMVQSLSKLGPILGMVSTGIMAVVKLLIDAEAQAKGFQKDLLQSASTIEIMGKEGWNARASFAELKDTVRGVRDAAFDAEFNLDWGITADTHKAVYNALNQEGVSLQRIRDEAKLAGKDVETFSKGLVGVSVAYSRAFGVPLQQINEQQAQLMTDMGQSASEVETAFAQMARSASDSGIAANKFYAIIRGVSQDLSLYNIRMGETVKLLKMLGKVMNPRNAAKFMQMATKGLKDMGRTERLKLTMLAGAGKVGQIVDRDIKRKTDILSKKLSMDSKEVMSILKTKGAKGLAAAIGKLPSEAQGAVTEMATKLQLQMTRRKKGTFGISGAAADVGPGAALEIIEEAVGRFSKGKSLEDAVGELGTEMIAENLGISQEELDQRIQFKMAMDMEREKMKALLEKSVSGQELTAEETERLKAMTDAGMTSAGKINEAGYDQLFDAMTDTAKQSAKDAGKVINYGKMQGSLTQSLLEKLGVLVDFVMNQLYNVLIDIWDSIPTSDNLKIAAARSKSKDVIEAAEASGGDPAKFAEEIGKTPVFKDMLNALYLSPEKIAEKEERAKALKHEAGLKLRGKDVYSPEEKAKKLAEAAKLEGEVASEKERSKAANRAVDAGTKGMSPFKITEAINSVLGNQRSDETFQSEVQLNNLLGQGKGMTEALAGSGFSEEVQKLIAGKALHYESDPASMAGAVGQYGQETGFTNEQMAEEAKKNAEAIATEAKAGAMETKDQTKEMKSANTVYFKFPGPWLDGPYKKAVEGAVLDAIRVGLFEYYMYSDLDREAVAKYMKSNEMSIQDFAEKAGTAGVESGKSLEDTLGIEASPDDEDDKKKTPKKSDGNQHGGLVSHIGPDGLAVFRTPPGEGMTGIGPGERIVPAYAGGGGGGGGGGSRVVIALAPDAQRLIQAEVQHGIIEHERRRKTAG